MSEPCGISMEVRLADGTWKDFREATLSEIAGVPLSGPIEHDKDLDDVLRICLHDWRLHERKIEFDPRVSYYRLRQTWYCARCRRVETELKDHIQGDPS